ncbi:hypothetical protein DPMN_100714 [Dreissena polymorpha]|uniref:Uncharacterized protein n=1 Tax=Dreissena polymorpha TaxID=45954 RepID=A0A9D4LGE4_DREPO|nr:hypothetical protein DPMN_100604 [Dreissena polymorpha]KAH3858095.1 hypothetical protein DPMN_100714 [Dreissena polymorpha]
MDILVAVIFFNVGFVQFMLEAEKQYNVLLGRERWRRRRRTCLVRNCLKPETRIAVGHYHQLIRLDDQESFYNFLRITPPMLDELSERITPLTEKSDTNYRKALKPGMKLSLSVIWKQLIAMSYFNMISG